MRTNIMWVKICLFPFILLSLSGALRGDIDIPYDLHDTTNSADYLIIMPDDFTSYIYPLAEWRSDNGFNVDIILLSRIQVEFGESTSVDSSIKDFIDYSYYNWAPPKPDYLLLVGDVEFLPSHMICRDLHASGSDSWFGCIEGDDNIPELAIGRFPANTIDELITVVNKTVQYEQNPLPGNWHKDILLAADPGESSAEGFCEYLSDNFIPADYTVSRVYTGERDSLIREIDEGCLLLYYYGHGASHIWSGSGLMTYSAIDSLNNGDMMPIVVAATCYQDFASGDCIPERFVVIENKGAIAAWASGGAVYPKHTIGAMAISTSFFDNFFSGSSNVLGEIILQTLTENVYDPLVQTLALMGDPALRIAYPDGIEEDENLRFTIDDLQLKVYPNPFFITTTIKYYIPVVSKVNIGVYDGVGRLIESLFAGERNPGYHRIKWDSGELPRGVYFVRLQAGDYTKAKKLILIK